MKDGLMVFVVVFFLMYVIGTGYFTDWSGQAAYDKGFTDGYDKGHDAGAKFTYRMWKEKLIKEGDCICSVDPGSKCLCWTDAVINPDKDARGKWIKEGERK